MSRPPAATVTAGGRVRPLNTRHPTPKHVRLASWFFGVGTGERRVVNPPVSEGGRESFTRLSWRNGLPTPCFPTLSCLFASWPPDRGRRARRTRGVTRFF